MKDIVLATIELLGAKPENAETGQSETVGTPKELMMEDSPPVVAIVHEYAKTN